MYVIPVISANTSFAHDSIYIVLTGGFNTLCDMPANTEHRNLNTTLVARLWKLLKTQCKNACERLYIYRLKPGSRKPRHWLH